MKMKGYKNLISTARFNFAKQTLKLPNNEMFVFK